ncbi:MAG: hypothetical protein AB8H80_17170 [Planctomycetota bacterium]
MRKTTCPIVLFVFAACASVDGLGPRETGSVQVHRADAAGSSSGEAPSGWIYAFDRVSGQPDACIYIWPNNAWSLGMR